MTFIVKGIGVPGDPLWLTAPNESDERTLSANRADADVFSTRREALNAIAWLRRADLPARLRPAVLYVIDADQPHR